MDANELFYMGFHFAAGCITAYVVFRVIVVTMQVVLEKLFGVHGRNDR